ncbi:4Fe-4S dicluster domain-containing protein [Salipaludibacillus daqingensis]|uniref:4Fe-4S dicluster domain-containing protein n=1 Tax=Salipaludibacillus daqingensis TaxID=3041001 RepID=UPI002474E29D|nr:4Fe-4S dicluster domain-containing protein [Salipaludibacillus daqingensis]
MALQLGFKVIIDRCTSCRGCELACINENQLGQVKRRTIKPFETKRKDLPIVQFSIGCNHCKNPACIAVCPMHCFKKRRDGVVIHDPTNCIGCQSCVGACPFQAPSMNEHTRKVDKCNLCAPRLDRGQKPACVSACINSALQLVNLSEQDSLCDSTTSVNNIKMMQYTKPSLVIELPKYKTRSYLRSSQT